MFLNFFLLMENLGAMADPRYTGFREITDRDLLEPHCISIWKTLINFLSETTGPISIKPGRNVSLVTLYQGCSSCHDSSKTWPLGGGAYFPYISI